MNKLTKQQALEKIKELEKYIEEIKKVIVENSECIPSEMSELVDTLIASIRAEAYEKGFIAGADATGSQAEEVLALKLKEQENEIIKKIATKEVHCELKGYKIGNKERKKEILELIYGEIKKTAENGKDTRNCECLENIYQKIIKLK